MLALLCVVNTLAHAIATPPPATWPAMRLPSDVTPAPTRLLSLRGGGTAPKASDVAPLASAVALHGLCLVGCGFYAQSSLGKTLGAALVASAPLVVSQNFPAYMVGVHVALLLQVGSAGAFGVQAARAGLAQLQGAKMCSVAGKLLPYAVMSASSVGTFGAMSKLKPKKKKAA